MRDAVTQAADTGNITPEAADKAYDSLNKAKAVQVGEKVADVIDWGNGLKWVIISLLLLMVVVLVLNATGVI